MLHPIRTIRTILVGICLALMPVLLGACASGGSERIEAEDAFAGADATSGAPGQALPSRIYAFEGESLVIPVRGPGVIGSPVRTEDGRVLSTSLHLVTRVSPPLMEGLWLDGAGGWRSREVPLDEPSEGEASGGLWMVLVGLPDGYANRPLYTGDRRLPVIWAPTPPATTDSRFMSRLIAAGPAWRELGDVLEPLRRDPSNRWRVRLLTDRVSPDRLWGAGAPSVVEIESEVLEALARQTEMRYRAAIARVQLADPALASELLMALTTIVSMTDGQLLPAWTDATPRLNAIIDTALNTTRPPARAAEAARSWLNAISPVQSWVIDDGSRTLDGDRYATVGVANLSNASVDVSVAPLGEPASDRATVRPQRALTIGAPVLVDPPAVMTESPSARPLVVRTGRPVARMRVLTPGRSFDPPGLRVDGLFATWTRRSWLAQRPSVMSGDQRTMALLQQSPDGQGWEIYIECATRAAPLEGSDDRVRIWLGPYGGSEGYLLAGPGAEARLRSAEPPMWRAHEWGWSSVVEIPAAMIGSSGTIDFAVERIDASGVRSTWPRPMLPGQNEPGRATVRLTTWGAPIEGP